MKRLMQTTLLALSTLTVAEAGAVTFTAPKIPILYANHFCQDQRHTLNNPDQLWTNDDGKGRVKWAINTCSYIQKKYLGDMLFTTYVDDDGVPHTQPRTWVQYPIFGTWNDATQLPASIWIAPKHESAACTLPDGTVWLSNCEAGCVTGDQQVRFAGGVVEAATASTEGKLDLLTLSSDSTLQSYKYQVTPVQRYTYSDERLHDLLLVSTSEGSRIELTPNHPLLAPDGYVRDAASFKVGDQLVNADGKPETIVEVLKYARESEVYGIRPDSTNLKNHLFVTQNVINGSPAFGDLDGLTINRMVFRSMISEDVL